MPEMQWGVAREGANNQATGGWPVNKRQAAALARIDTMRITVDDIQSLHPYLPRFLARWLLRGDSFRRNPDGTYQFIGR